MPWVNIMLDFFWMDCCHEVRSSENEKENKNQKKPSTVKSMIKYACFICCLTNFRTCYLDITLSHTTNSIRSGQVLTLCRYIGHQ